MASPVGRVGTGCRTGGRLGGGYPSERGGDAAGPPWTRPARSSSAELAAAPAPDADQAAAGAAGSGPPASRSAALPASPWPSTARLASRSAAATAPAPVALVRPGPAPPVAHGGGAAQSRGGLRCTGGSSVAGCGGASPSMSSTLPIGPGDGTAVGAVSGRSPTPRVWAASRLAQSWNVGHTGKALDRQ